jgi:hypothetical protein
LRPFVVVSPLPPVFPRLSSTWARACTHFPWRRPACTDTIVAAVLADSSVGSSTKVVAVPALPPVFPVIASTLWPWPPTQCVRSATAWPAVAAMRTRRVTSSWPVPQPQHCHFHTFAPPEVVAADRPPHDTPSCSRRNVVMAVMGVGWRQWGATSRPCTPPSTLPAQVLQLSQSSCNSFNTYLALCVMMRACAQPEESLQLGLGGSWGDGADQHNVCQRLLLLERGARCRRPIAAACFLRIDHCGQGSAAVHGMATWPRVHPVMLPDGAFGSSATRPAAACQRGSHV